MATIRMTTGDRGKARVVGQVSGHQIEEVKCRYPLMPERRPSCTA